MAETPTLSGIHVYPVKSLRGMDVTSWPLDARGLRGDRRFMVVTPDGRFLTQREAGGMARVAAYIDSDRLMLEAPGMASQSLPWAPQGEELDVTVWRDVCRARSAGVEADAWMSAALGRECRLVVLPDDSVRGLPPQYADSVDQTGFADVFPFLIISEASLGDLNVRLAEQSEGPLPMRRFRPNLVIRGTAPFAEDSWKRIRIGDVELRVVKPCSRCVITTRDPETGEVTGKEPLRTLATYRKLGGEWGNEVFFGQNAIHRPEDAGRALTLGDAVEVLEHA